MKRGPDAKCRAPSLTLEVGAWGDGGGGLTWRDYAAAPPTPQSKVSAPVRMRVGQSPQRSRMRTV